MPQIPLVVVLGPTASGKSDLALSLARRTPAEVIGCDSVQVYRGFDIGSGKATPEVREEIPHHLIDVAGSSDVFTAGDYLRLARDSAAGIAARNRIPVVVGGTGFYLRAFLQGLCPAPARPELRQRLERIALRRPEQIHRILSRLDLGSASRIHPNDVHKAIRAVEVAFGSGQPLSRIHEEGRNALEGYRTLKIGLRPPREQLREEIERRCRLMWKAGLLEETAALLEGCTGLEKPFTSLGYAQCLKVLRKELDPAAALEEMIVRTRQYAKRQFTWFRREENVRWFDTFGSHPETIRGVLQIVHNFANYTL